MQDYSLRAKDHNIKKVKIKQLREKVALKNPDEFYFGMLSQKGPSTQGKNRTGTKNGDRGNAVLSQDKVRSLKTQDLTYVRTMRNTAAKAVQKLREQAAGIKSKGKKIVFVDDREEQAAKFEAEDSFGDWEDEEDKDEDIGLSKEAKEAKRLRKMREKEADKIGRKLQIAEEQLKGLTEEEKNLDLQRAKMSKTPTVGGVTKSGKKFKIRERKR